MRVLWVCNLILPDFSDEFGIIKQNFGGWLTGMYHGMLIYPDIELGFCFPVYDNNRMKNGVFNMCKYYSFHGKRDYKKYEEDFEQEFISIFQDFNPDIIHIWGTEYNHARAAMNAAIKIGIKKRVLIDLQGLVSVISKHYTAGIADEELQIKNEAGQSIENEWLNMIEKGENEKEVILEAEYVSGRTEWDKFCVNQLNPEIKYLNCNRILRDEFYTEKRKWNIKKCQKYRIVVGQAFYSVKGFHFLLEALPTIVRAFPNVKVYVAGKNPLLPDKSNNISPYGMYIKKRIEKDSFSEKIVYTGELSSDKMIELYLSANVFVSSSTIENASNAISEAMYLGVPVVVSDVGGSLDLVSHRFDGLVYRYDAPYMLAGHVMQIFENDRLARRLSENAIRTSFSKSNYIKIREKQYNNYKYIFENNNINQIWQESI